LRSGDESAHEYVCPFNEPGAQAMLERAQRGLANNAAGARPGASELDP